MAERENVEIVRRYIAARGRDMDALLADVDPAVVWVVGDQVLVVTDVSATGAGSGVEATARGVGVYTVEGAKITRFELFQTKVDALEAVGLPESSSGP